MAPSTWHCTARHRVQVPCSAAAEAPRPMHALASGQHATLSSQFELAQGDASCSSQPCLFSLAQLPLPKVYMQRPCPFSCTICIAKNCAVTDLQSDPWLIRHLHTCALIEAGAWRSACASKLNCCLEKVCTLAALVMAGAGYIAILLQYKGHNIDCVHNEQCSVSNVFLEQQDDLHYLG